jgi:hypothetical protein
LRKNSSLEDAQINKNSNKNDESIRISGFQNFFFGRSGVVLNSMNKQESIEII